MTDPPVAQRLRRFLLMLSGLICAGTAVELSFIGHTEDVVQFVPFILCGLGLCVVAAVLYAPRRRPLLLLRVVMGGVALGSVVGIYQHVAHNLAFELEIHPNATAGDVFWGALGGASPLLAPGILALAATLAIAATYEHPALTTPRDAQVPSQRK